MGSKISSTPMDSTIWLHQDPGPLFYMSLLFWRLVGRLLYLTTTRPNIYFATQQISQYMANPTQAHFRATTRIMKYLKGCPA